MVWGFVLSIRLAYCFRIEIRPSYLSKTQNGSIIRWGPQFPDFLPKEISIWQLPIAFRCTCVGSYIKLISGTLSWHLYKNLISLLISILLSCLFLCLEGHVLMYFLERPPGIILKLPICVFCINRSTMTEKWWL